MAELFRIALGAARLIDTVNGVLLWVGIVGAVLVAAGLLGIRRSRRASAVVHEDRVRAEHLESRNRLQDRDLMALALDPTDSQECQR
jgi:LPXTG-motif cell wall-anchored protein